MKVINPEMVKWAYVLILKYRYKVSALAIVDTRDIKEKKSITTTNSDYRADEGNGPLTLIPKGMAWNHLKIGRQTPLKKFLDIWCGRGNRRITKNEPWK